MALKHHRMQLPREVMVGNGTINRIGEICRKLNFLNSALVISGKKTYNIAGKTVEEILREEGLKVDILLVESSSVEDVKFVEEKIKELHPQIVAGVGGGTKIDVAKCSSANQQVPFISVPTNASHDGIVSPLSSIKGFIKPYSIMAQAPIAIIADTNVIMKSPWRFSVSGCGDVLSKITAVKDWQLAQQEIQEYYGEYAASLALMSARLIIKNENQIRPENEEGLRVLLEALISCGVAMSIAGSSRPCSGSEHMFSHALDAIRPDRASHGEQCAVGAIMMAYLHNLNWRKIKATLANLGAPTTAISLRVDREDVLDAFLLATTIRPERFTILNKLKLSRNDCVKVAEATEVI